MWDNLEERIEDTGLAAGFSVEVGVRSTWLNSEVALEVVIVSVGRLGLFGGSGRVF